MGISPSSKYEQEHGVMWGWRSERDNLADFQFWHHDVCSICDAKRLNGEARFYLSRAPAHFPLIRTSEKRHRPYVCPTPGTVLYEVCVFQRSLMFRPLNTDAAVLPAFSSTKCVAIGRDRLRHRALLWPTQPLPRGNARHQQSAK